VSFPGKHNRGVYSLLESLGQSVKVSRRRKGEGDDLIMNHAPELPAVNGPGSHVEEIEDSQTGISTGYPARTLE